MVSYALGLFVAWAAAGRWPLAAVALLALAGTVGGTLAAGVATSLWLGLPVLAGL